MNASPTELVPPNVLASWRAALSRREPRAMELAYALELALPTGDVPAPPAELSPEVQALLESSAARYDAFREGTVHMLDVGNANLLAFERVSGQERVLVVSNLTAASQPVKFGALRGLTGWDMLNRVEFSFPPRAQLDPYEFLWLYLEVNE